MAESNREHDGNRAHEYVNLPLRIIMTESRWNRSTEVACFSANIWADEVLAKYQASCAGDKDSSGFLSSPDNQREKSQIAAGKERGAAALRAFEEEWNKSGARSSW